jgi:hypothetical protein
MTKKAEQRKILTDKAAKVNLTLDQFILLVQLGGDVAEYSDDRIQPMSFQKTPWGCQLNLMSINCAYRVQVSKDHRLRCVCERYGRGSGVIHQSDDTVQESEILRKRILWMEGVEIMTENDFDTCQTLKAMELV